MNDSEQVEMSPGPTAMSAVVEQAPLVLKARKNTLNDKQKNKVVDWMREHEADVLKMDDGALADTLTAELGFLVTVANAKHQRGVLGMFPPPPPEVVAETDLRQVARALHYVLLRMNAADVDGPDHALVGHLDNLARIAG